MTGLSPAQPLEIRWLRPVIPVFLLLGLALGSTSRPHLALINESPSLPPGLYLLQPGALQSTGAVVALRQPAGTLTYLARLGMPSEVRLLKRVGAMEGDRVCARDGRIQVTGRIVPVLETDRQGRRLPNWSGCRVLARGERFLLGDTAGSFDSRYFGPVPDTAIEGVYRRVLTW